MRTRRPPRGVTLIELVVAMAVSTLVAAAGVALLVSQQQAFRSGSDDRAMQETARMALEEVATGLRMAGYGLDPVLAFDFGALAGVRIDRAPAGELVAIRAQACATPVLCRDSETGADELAFRSRDPAFNHLTTAAATKTELSITGPLNAPLRKGQILQVACLSGTLEWAFVTVDAEVAATTGIAPVTVPLENVSGSDFPLQGDWLEHSCFQVPGQVSVLKVDRYRYFVRTFDAAGNAVGWNTSGGRPFLLLDQGLTDAAGAAIVTPVAADVEDLQVTYLFPAAIAPAATAVPPTPGTRLADGEGGIDRAPAAGAPTYATLRGDPSRATNYPANLRGVRVAVSVRSAVPRPAPGSDADNLIPAAGNRRATAAAETGYRHLLFETTVAPRNLDARTPYLPANSASAGTDRLNVGGG